jgi:uncharacterized protein YcgL (UPF0745 family)
MLCVIYKSSKKAQTFLFVKQRDDFSSVPEGLMTVFGSPTLVTILNLATKKKLALADLNVVKDNLVSKGFYLQLPPPEENLLDQHKADMKFKTKQEA